MLALTALFVFGFVLVHLFVGRLRFLDVVPRSRWLSFAGGVAVAYVFLHILPELGGHRRTFAAQLELGERAAESWVYLVALAGLALFYGLSTAWSVRPRIHAGVPRSGAGRTGSRPRSSGSISAPSPFTMC